MNCFYLHKGDFKLFKYRPTLFITSSDEKVQNGFHLHADGETLTVTSKDFEKNAVIVTEEIRKNLFLTL